MKRQVTGRQSHPARTDLVLNGATGEMESRKDFRDRHLIDRIVGTGIAAHEGQLFGPRTSYLGF